MKKQSETKKRTSKQPNSKPSKAPRRAAEASAGEASVPQEAFAEVDNWLADDPPYEELDDADEAFSGLRRD